MEDQIANLIPPQVLEEKEAHIGVLRREMTQMRAHHREVRGSEERSDELTTLLQAAKTPRAHTSVQGPPPP